MSNRKVLISRRDGESGDLETFTRRLEKEGRSCLWNYRWKKNDQSLDLWTFFSVLRHWVGIVKVKISRMSSLVKEEHGRDGKWEKENHTHTPGLVNLLIANFKCVLLSKISFILSRCHIVLKSSNLKKFNILSIFCTKFKHKK